LIKTFYDSDEHISTLVGKIYRLKDEKSVQLALRNSWSLGNLCETSSIGALSQPDREKIFEMCVQFSKPTYKDKVTAHAIRAIGHIFANCKEFENLNNDVIGWEEFFMLLVQNIEHKSPKVSWNSCVLLRSIMDNSYIRDKIQDLLFSKDTITSLCHIIKENSNFKTRIHSVQTLSKLRDYYDYGECNLEVWDSFLSGFQHVTETSEFTDVNYISTLEFQLVNLFVKLVKMVEEGQNHTDKFSEFLNGRSRELEASIKNYLQKQFGVTAFSAVLQEEVSKELEENKDISTESGTVNKSVLLKETICEIQTAFKTIVKLIDSSGDIKVPFSVYETFNALATTDTENFADLELLKIKKTAFDKDQF